MSCKDDHECVHHNSTGVISADQDRIFVTLLGRRRAHKSIEKNKLIMHMVSRVNRDYEDATSCSVNMNRSSIAKQTLLAHWIAIRL